MIKRCIAGIVALAAVLTTSAQQTAHGFLMGDYDGRYGFVSFKTSSPCDFQITHRTTAYNANGYGKSGKYAVCVGR